MLYIAFVCIFLSIFLFTYNKNHLSKKKGEIAQIMRSTRSKYHYVIPTHKTTLVVHYVKKNEELLRNNAMSKSISRKERKICI